MATTNEPQSVTADSDRTWHDITWLDIGSDGTERERSGHIWAAAPPLAAMRAWWVLPDGGGEAVLVARANRRHRVGRTFGVIYAMNAGRYIDVGECFRETDARSRFNRTFTPPTHVTLKPMDATASVALESFARLCSEAERG